MVTVVGVGWGQTANIIQNINILGIAPMAAKTSTPPPPKVQQHSRGEESVRDDWEKVRVRPTIRSMNQNDVFVVSAR